MWINSLGLTFLNKPGNAAHISYGTQRMLRDFISRGVTPHSREQSFMQDKKQITTTHFWVDMYIHASRLICVIMT